ncbi:MAG: hypothetical protein ABIB43_03915 [archaeon]
MVNLNDKRREWLENLRDLKRKKQKELEELEEKKKKELEEAEEMLQAGVEELSSEEEEILEHLRKEIPELGEIEKQAKEEEKNKTLEETLAGERAAEELRRHVDSSQVEQTIDTFYRVSDYNVYNDLKQTLEKVQRGDYISQSERNGFYKQQEEFARLSKDHSLEEKDSFGYIERSKQVMESIAETLHSRVEYKVGDDH